MLRPTTREERVNCPICAGPGSRDFAVSNGMKIVRCEGCGLLYVNPRGSSEAHAAHFEDEYIKDEKRATVDFISFREESLKREADIIKKLLPRGGRLLDIGAASGAFLKCFKGDPRWKAEGVEPSRFAAEFACKELGLKVHQGFLIDQKFPSSSFDVLTSLDTFMLHPEPEKDLKEMARILKPGGLLAVEIPGLSFRLFKNKGVVCRLLYGVPVKLNAGVHLYYYSKETLSRLCAKFGFEVAGSYPERSPSYGPVPFRMVTAAYYSLTGLLYRVSSGAINACPKEFIVFRKRGA